MVQFPDTSYSSIDFLPYFNFVEILKTGNLEWLGRHEDPEEVWLDIQNEYCIAAKVDNSNLKQEARVIGLERKYIYISGCLEILRHSYLLKDFPEHHKNWEGAKKALSMFGYLVDGHKEFTAEFTRLINQLAGLKTKISIERSKIEKNNKKQGIILWKEIVQLEKQVPQVKIDPYKDPVAKVIEIQNLAKQISNEQRNHRLNSRR